MSVRSPFRRRGKGVQVQLPADERAALARLLGDVHTMLDDGGGPAGAVDAAADTDRDPLADLVGDDRWLADLERQFAGAAGGVDGEGPADLRTAAERFDDPAVARLLPDAHRDDPAAAAEFRRLTERGLRSRKRAALDLARGALTRPEPVVLDAQEAQALLKGLTDVRLVIAERLGLKTDEHADLMQQLLAGAGDSDEPWVVMAALYDELTWWQEALVRELPR